MDNLGNRPIDVCPDIPWVDMMCKDKAAEIGPVMISESIWNSRRLILASYYTKLDWSQCNNVTKQRNLIDLDVD